MRFYLQPTLFSKEPLSPWEEHERALVAAGEPLYRAVYERLGSDPELASGGRFHDLSDALSGDGAPFFFDWCHLSEAGNRRMAERIADSLSPRLEAEAE